MNKIHVEVWKPLRDLSRIGRRGLGVGLCGLASVWIPAREMAERGGDGWSGLAFRMVSDRFVVTRVAAESPAAIAGIEVGWVLEQVQRPSDKEPIDAASIRELAIEIRKFDTARMQTILANLAMNFTSGAIDETLELTFLDNQDQPRQIRLKLMRGPGQFAKLGYLPATYVTFEYLRLANKVGYIRFNAFLDAPRLIQEYQAALLDDHNANGVVIDLHR